jgi:hypothetical protein
MAKAKRYNGEDGSVTEGQNKGIGDDTRARAMKYIQEQSEKGSEDESSGEKTVSRSTKAKVSAKPSEAKGASVDDEAGRSRGIRGDGETKTTMGATPPRMRTRAEIKDAIPTGGRAGAGPTAGNGNSVDSTETSRNLSAIMNAAGPGKLVTGLSLAAREAKAADTAQKAYNARAAMRRSEEGLSAAEAADKVAKTARAAREAKTLNPNAWMAGPKGMKENFKSGGGVKGWGIARGSRKAKTY